MAGDEIYEVDFITVNRELPFEDGAIVIMANNSSRRSETRFSERKIGPKPLFLFLSLKFLHCGQVRTFLFLCHLAPTPCARICASEKMGGGNMRIDL
jgi:hypothetical protein